ncbi:uncharacterized protein LOC132903038 [Amyelois transitella]|uniref:uncharacterized protein LOC106138118 n=1 Tax=Amyelois transitella TaxID=680683 RepID=UPI0029905F3B|nr:uncharacterized protein LOC106138118 [Amyelois transitella]XP_060806190.1 uncharacterized protein LOC132903038 [Amyelois transitella]
MPRVYTSKSSKPYKKYDPLILNSAILAYQTGNASIVEVAKQFNISKSVLHRHATRRMKCQGGQKALSDEVEKYIIKYINVCSEWGYPLDTYDLRIIIKGYLDRMGHNIKKIKNNFPGVGFAESFLKRHCTDISERLSQNIKRSRAAVSPEIIVQYFEELERSLQGVDLANIVNYDESNLADDPGKKKVLSKRGAKYPERVMNHTKSSTSLMMAVAADGTLLPCYVVYKAAHLYNTWTTNGPPNCRYNRTNSGWFDGDTFEDWVETVAIPYFNNKVGKKILIGDNLSSHLSIELIRKCRELDINFVFLPPNSTHLTQPLDVAFFRPTKTAWRDILFTWKKTEGRILPTIPKNVFPKLLKKMLDKMEPNIKQNILSGFAKTGISPLNKEKVLNRLPGYVTRNEFDAEEKEAIDESVLNLLKEMRYGPQNSRPIKKMKKLNVKPGRSVEDSTGYIDSDISNSEITPQPKISGKGKGIGKKTKKDSSNNILEVKKTEKSMEIDNMTIIMDNEIPIMEDKVIYTDLNTYDEERMSDNTKQEPNIESIVEINLLHEDKVNSLTGHNTGNEFGTTEKEAINEPVLILQKNSYGSKKSRSNEMKKLNVKTGRGAKDRRKGKGIGKKSKKENVSNNIIVAKKSEESFEVNKMPIIMTDEFPIVGDNVIYNDLTIFHEDSTIFDYTVQEQKTEAQYEKPSRKKIS